MKTSPFVIMGAMYLLSAKLSRTPAWLLLYNSFARLLAS
jgi:hypothetical protein